MPRRGSATRVAKVAPAARRRGGAGTRVRADPLRPACGVRRARRVSARSWSPRCAARCAAAPDADLGYGCVAGAPSAARRPRRLLGRARGVVGRPDDIVVTAGSRRRSRCWPGCTRPRRAARARRGAGFAAPPRDRQRAGLELSPSTVDDDGLRGESLPPAAAALVRPAHQFPTDDVPRAERRAALLRVADAVAPVVDRGRLRRRVPLRPQPLAALHGLGAGPCRLPRFDGRDARAPRSRLGSIILPGGLARRRSWTRAGWANDESPTLDQLALGVVHRPRAS